MSAAQTADVGRALTAEIIPNIYQYSRLNGFAKFSDGKTYEFYPDKIKGGLRFRGERNEDRNVVVSCGSVRFSFVSVKREAAVRAALAAARTVQP